MPNLKNLPNRGAHATGTVKGLPSEEDIYVPRASWTETMDSPLKNRSVLFDEGAFVQHEKMKEMQRSATRSMHVRELERQVEEARTRKQSLADEKQQLMRSTMADSGFKDQVQMAELDAQTQGRRDLRAGLDHAANEKARRKQEAILYKQREGEELKQRTSQQLYEEMLALAKRRETATKEMVEGQRKWEASKREKREEKLREDELLRSQMMADASGEEQRLEAQKARIKGALAEQDQLYRHYEATAGKQLAARKAHEERRQDRDEKIHMARTDMFYAQREAARERQRQQMITTLGFQVEDERNRRAGRNSGKEAEKDALDAEARRAIEQDLAAKRSKHEAAAKHQKELLAMIAERKDRAARESGLRPATTMDSHSLHQKLDASKYLEKPMGRMEAYPRADVVGAHHSRSLRPSHDDLAAKPSQAAAPPVPLLTKQTKEPPERWSRGLTQDDIRAGRKEASRRLEKQAADRSTTM